MRDTFNPDCRRDTFNPGLQEGHLTVLYSREGHLTLLYSREGHLVYTGTSGGTPSVHRDIRRA